MTNLIDLEAHRQRLADLDVLAEQMGLQYEQWRDAIFDWSDDQVHDFCVSRSEEELRKAMQDNLTQISSKRATESTPRDVQSYYFDLKFIENEIRDGESKECVQDSIDDLIRQYEFGLVTEMLKPAIDAGTEIKKAIKTEIKRLQIRWPDLTK